MSDSPLVGRVHSAVRRLVRGRRIVIICTALAGATRFVDDLRSHHSGGILVLGLTRGTGPIPAEDEARCVLCDRGPMRSIADELEVTSRWVNDPPGEARAAVERFDPTGESLVYIIGIPGASDDYLGRETIGGRPPAFEALEDKTLSERLWIASRVPHVAEAVAPCTWEAVQQSNARVDSGSGTVWSADASGGVNGGADRVFRVRTHDEARRVHDELRQVSRRVRIMPFLEGIPCSIHGIVVGDEVAVLRPVELLVLRPPNGRRFRYAGLSTGWDPPSHRRREMRDMARRVGRHLAAAHGYRGAFGVDGVMTTEGFRPTELNPRLSGGISTIAKGAPDVPITWIHQLLLAGHDLGATAHEIEEVLVPAADAARVGAAYTSAAGDRASETQTVLVAGTADGLRVVTDESDSIGTLEHGPGTHGDLVRFTPHEVSPGTRLAPWAVAALDLADRLWDTGFGVLCPAPDRTTA